MKRILIVSNRFFDLTRLERELHHVCGRPYLFVQCQGVEEAAEILVDLTIPVALLVLEIDGEGIADFLAQLGGDELFAFLPVLGLVQQAGTQVLQRTLRMGSLFHLEVSQLEQLFVDKISSILNHSHRIDQLEKKMSNLQEKAIHDFILLDIIKNYIPRTIWYLAENFAEKQRFSIPETELDMSICFGDICQFSSFAQFRTPKEVITMLNRLFEVTTRYVHHFGGDVDKFIGDAFLAVFADLPSAVAAMFGVQREIRRRNQGAKGEKLMTFRIGVHAGKVIRGDVGGHHRFDNTLIGDAVNTASRLEGKATPGGLVVSEEVRKRLKLDIPLRYRLASELKGRQGEEVFWNIFDFFDHHPRALPVLSRLEEREEWER